MKNLFVFVLLMLMMLTSITGIQSQNFQYAANATLPQISDALFTPYTPGTLSANVASNAGNDPIYTSHTSSWLISDNTIGSDQAICYNTTPGALTGSVPTGGNGTFTYQWQNSITSATTGFTNIGGAIVQDYAPGVLTATNWYRRIVTSGAETDTSAAVTITVTPIIMATSNVISAGQAICSGTEPEILTGTVPTGGTGTYTYQWQKSTDNALFTDITGAVSSGYSPGIMTATAWFLRVVTSNVCSNTSAAVKITVDPMPEATIAYPGTPYCGTGTASVTQTGLSGGTYSAAAGLSINAGTGEINLVGSTPGIYTVNYTFSNGSCSNTTTTNVQVGNPTLVITNPEPICAPSSVNLTNAAITAGSTEGLTYGYYSNSSGTIALTNPTAVSATGTKTYYIRGTSAAGCKSTVKPVVVKINTQPFVTAIGPGGPVCKGMPVNLTAFSPDFSTTFEWVGSEAGGSAVVYPTVNTTYTVIATNAFSCTKSQTVNVQVRDFSLVLAANPNPILAGTSVMLNSSSNANYQVTAWLPQMYFSNQTALSQSVVLSDTSKTFYVIGKSDEGCIDTASVNVNVNVNTKDVFVPNAFTPNNDGKNDIFKVYGSSVKAADIRIYNQWGTLMYETSDNNHGWDGTYKGKPQPVGVYIYIVKIRLYDEDTFIKKGTLNLIR